MKGEAGFVENAEKALIGQVRMFGNPVSSVGIMENVEKALIGQVTNFWKPCSLFQLHGERREGPDRTGDKFLGTLFPLSALCRMPKGPDRTGENFWKPCFLCRLYVERRKALIGQVKFFGNPVPSVGFMENAQRPCSDRGKIWKPRSTLNRVKMRCSFDIRFLLLKKISFCSIIEYDTRRVLNVLLMRRFWIQQAFSAFCIYVLYMSCKFKTSNGSKKIKKSRILS
jgi:hypothetical protein